MIVIPISGIIAEWEMESESNVTPTTLRRSLENAGGKAVRIDINSPGGDVFQGLEMYNLIKNYLGYTETRVVSMAASMGSVIALAGDKKTAEKTAAYMIHNPWGPFVGDYREMREAADDLEAVTEHLANIYVDRTDVEKEQIRQIMDSGKWIYGEDLRDFGFSIIDSGGIFSLEENRIESKKRYNAFVKAQENHLKEHRSALKQVAASIGGLKMSIFDTVNPFRDSAKLVDEPWDKTASEQRWRDHAGVRSNTDLPNTTYSKRFSWYDQNEQENFGSYKLPIFDYKRSQGGEFINVSAVRNGLARLSQSDIPQSDQNRIRSILERYLDKFNERESAANAVINITEEKKTVKNIADFKAQYPDLYAAAVQVGIDQERDRVKAHITMGRSSGATDLAMRNIEEGSDFSQSISAEYMSAGLKNQDKLNRQSDDPDLQNINNNSLLEDDQEAYENRLSAKRKGVRK